jgi:L,D-peptidoglycan transpeptidase YkuD (ErfK/YbiS/YcfS/YnhG family)
MNHQRQGFAQLRLANRAASKGWLELGALRLPCAIGRGGLRAMKREGDGGTPIGAFALRELLYRADQLRRPRTPLPTHAIRPADGWCDGRSDRNYNRPVTRPYPASSEELWRRDRLYDVVGVMDYNIAPRAQGRGSCIFLHVARPDYAPTEGCVALALEDLLRLLEGPAPLRGIDTRMWQGGAA